MLWLGRLLVGSVGITATILIGVSVVLPLAVGGSSYAVLTSSMRPDLPPGSLIVVRPVQARDLGVGDVITYQRDSGAPIVVTHRIVAQATDAQGRPIFRTQGDANPQPDPAWVQPVQIRGEVWFAVPYAGRVHDLLDPATRRWLTIVAAAALLLSGARSYRAAWRERHVAPSQAEVRHG
ncbi:signal peptidase I [Nocardioides sp. R-C-SC26]|uniref:signal peptidase I n=1 Tax=Nocardioides sp. R-C-SC26 TaxID=2870414 RepID=UPI001E65E229|nr:signal peptidase I [Nocardioides sp. R-C-SC26]